MTPAPHVLSGALYAEYEAIIAAVIYGIEAAAQISLALCVVFLAFRGGLGIARAAGWR